MCSGGDKAWGEASARQIAGAGGEQGRCNNTNSGSSRGDVNRICDHCIFGLVIRYARGIIQILAR